MAADLNLYIDQGATFRSEITISDDSGVPVDITNYTITSQFRKSYGSTVSTAFSVTLLDPVNGVLELSLTSTQTANIKPGRYVYDAKYTLTDTVVFVKGILTVYPGVTR